MAPIDLNLLRAFTALYETGSFTNAAKRLGVPRSTISRAIAALEEQLGEELVHRTTRIVSISTEGKELFDRVSPSLTSLDAALADRPEHDEPTGLLRITATQDLSAALLAEATVRFTLRYPRTQVELIATTEMLDLTRDGIDCAIRIVKGRMPDSTNVVQRLGVFTWQLFAAPAYLARRGVPRSAKDLGDHDWMGFKGVTPAPNRSSDRLGEGRIVSDDVFVARELLRHGGGIGGLPVFLAAEDLQTGMLVSVLPKVTLISAPVYLVRPARKHVASRVTAFRQLLLELLRQRPLT